ncbi:hypothetical protein [Nocardia sp. NPDC051570]|uniref:hypothetical protein n=1 Tax=Nocardia sp. NPDC051570 TaxID=3364324 RepID=UPI0037B711F9
MESTRRMRGVGVSLAAVAAMAFAVTGVGNAAPARAGWSGVEQVSFSGAAVVGQAETVTAVTTCTHTDTDGFIDFRDETAGVQIGEVEIPDCLDGRHDTEKISATWTPGTSGTHEIIASRLYLGRVADTDSNVIVINNP